MPNDILVLPQSKTQQQEFSWGTLTWFANRTLGNVERLEIIGDGENLVVENNIRLIHYRRSKNKIEYGRAGDYFGALKDDSAPLYWEPEFSLGQLYNKGLFLLGYAPEVIEFTTRLLDDKGPAYGTLEDALELLQIYEAYLLPDGIIHPIESSS